MAEDNARRQDDKAGAKSELSVSSTIGYPTPLDEPLPTTRARQPVLAFRQLSSTPRTRRSFRSADEARTAPTSMDSMTPLDEAADPARLLATEREARRRLESLSALLPVVASTLDIHEIFERVSAIAKEALAHDALGIQLLQVERNTIVAYVVSDHPVSGSWEYPILRELDEPELDFIADDAWFEDDSQIAVMKGRFVPGDTAKSPPGEMTVKLDGPRSRLVREHGFRSYLRVP